MTVDEFTKLAAAIKTYFPRDNILPTDAAMELWFDSLKDLDYQSASLSLRRYVATNKFPPTIADIRGNAVFEEEENEMRAWGLVQRALRNSGYHAEEEFEQLPPAVQRAISSPGQLREWARLEIGGGDWNVMQSNFMRTYRTELAREKERKRLSPDIRKLLDDVNNRLEISETENQRLTATQECPSDATE